jgi:hypothetical protein
MQRRQGNVLQIPPWIYPNPIAFSYLTPNTKKNMVYGGPYAGADYNFTLFPLQSRLLHIYHGQQYARVDLIPPVRAFGFGLHVQFD